MTYSLDAREAGHPVVIGTQTYTTSDQQLMDFNNGTSTQLDFQFDYTADNPQYYFQADREWPEWPHPYYVAQLSAMAPDTDPINCFGWVNKEDVRNNRRVVPFETPLPEFSLIPVPAVTGSCVDTDSDTVPDHCQQRGNPCQNDDECFKVSEVYPFFPGDAVIGEACVGNPGSCESSGNDCLVANDCTNMKFDLRVENHGVSWPPVGVSVDPVEISGRILFEKKVGGQWIQTGIELLGVQVVPTLAAGAGSDFSFQYNVDPSTLPPAYDRARIVFEVNGADETGSRSVWERTFLNNKHEILLRRLPGICPEWATGVFRD